MPTLISASPGYVTQLPDFSPPALIMTIGGEAGNLVAGAAGSFGQFKSIVTEIAIMRSGNYQFLHTLKDFIYVYVFGERISEMRVSGISFAANCDPNAQAGIPQISGIEKILDYYETSRIGNTGKAYDLILGSTDAGRYKGFLTGLQARMGHPDNRISEFGLQFKVFRQ